MHLRLVWMTTHQSEIDDHRKEFKYATAQQTIDRSRPCSKELQALRC